MAYSGLPITLSYSGGFTSNGAMSAISQALSSYRQANKQVVPERIKQLGQDGVVTQEYGNGLVYTYTIDKIGTELDVTYGSEEYHTARKDTQLYSVCEQAYCQEVVFVDRYRRYCITSWAELAKDLAPEASIVDAVLSIALQNLEQSLDWDLAEDKIKLLKSWTPKTTQIVKIPFVDTTGMTGIELTQTKLENALNAKRLIANAYKDATNLTNKYTDLTTYVDPNGDGTKTKEAKVSMTDDLTAIINTKYENYFSVYGEGQLYNNTVLDGLKTGANKIEVTPGQLGQADINDPKDGDEIMYLFEAGKFVRPLFLKINTSQQNRRTFGQSNYLHVIDGQAILKTLAAIKFVVELVQPA